MNQCEPVSDLQRESSVHGRLHLSFKHVDDGRTILSECRQQPPLKVVRGFANADGGAMVHLHNVSGGVLGGDVLEVSIHVAEDARAQVTTSGATRIYRTTNASGTSLQTTHVKVATRGLIEYVPDALIPFAGSRYRQETTIDLADDAGLFWWETVSPGREGHGETFAYERLDIRLNIFATDRRIASEQVRLEPSLRSPASPARLGTFFYWTSFYICRVGVGREHWLDLERQLADLANAMSRKGEVMWGVGTLAAHGVLVRAVGMSYVDIASGLPRFWSEAKRSLYNCDAIPPRKTP